MKEISKGTVIGLSVAATMIIGMLQNVMPVEMAWHYGWTIHNILITTLSLSVFSLITWESNTKLKAFFLLLSSWYLISTPLETASAFMYEAYRIESFESASYILFSIMFIFVITLLTKIIFMCRFPLKNDPYVKSRYMYSFVPVGRITGLNLLKPWTTSVYGGMAVLGDGKMWFVHKGKFGRIPVTKEVKNLLKANKLVDTGIQVSDKITKRLDSFVGKRAHMPWRTCNSLTVGISQSEAIRRQARNHR